MAGRSETIFWVRSGRRQFDLCVPISKAMNSCESLDKAAKISTEKNDFGGDDRS